MKPDAIASLKNILTVSIEYSSGVFPIKDIFLYIEFVIVIMSHPTSLAVMES
ncbi:uncharacterized protein METZ01_LOCUS502463 [marine metagenome]|uniref:Uncharacterized protein n=1 Tax=marine metagenome TaxID=408172 RepID=A0A383DZ42_9ZZZZ